MQCVVGQFSVQRPFANRVWLSCSCKLENSLADRSAGHEQAAESKGKPKFSLVNSYRQDLLHANHSLTKWNHIWFTQSHKVGIGTTVLQEVSMLLPDMAVYWAVKYKVLLVLHTIQ